MDDLPELRATIPALEPDPVLLGQLVELSAASTAASARPPLRPVRALVAGAAALGLVGATSWIAGALPGVPSPLEPHPTPAPVPTSPATPSPTGDARVPGADIGPTSDASLPHGEASDAGPLTRSSGWVPPGWVPPGRPSTRPTTPGEGRAVGRGPDKHPDPGKHLGQSKPNPDRPDPKGKGRRHSPAVSPPTSPPASPRAGRASERPTSDPTTGP